MSSYTVKVKREPCHGVVFNECCKLFFHSVPKFVEVELYPYLLGPFNCYTLLLLKCEVVYVVWSLDELAALQINLLIV